MATSIIDHKPHSSRTYLKVAALSAFVALVTTAAFVFFVSMHAFRAVVDLSRNVTLSNVRLAHELCEQFAMQMLLANFLYFAPLSAFSAAAICCLFRRTLEQTASKSGKKDLKSILVAPLIAWSVFILNPPPEFLHPFNPEIWRTFYLPVSRGKMVESLLTTFKYKGMKADDLVSLLGSPDLQKVFSDQSGSYSYSIDENNDLWLTFHFSEQRRISRAEIRGRKPCYFEY